ncbi:MAG TPA: glycosyltransferase family 2 protein [Actinomycetota bacterium]|nr:glycosyltransferase family 2 protein [Actinomycetota bacterium]
MHNAVAIVFVSTDEGHVLIPALESLSAHPPEHPLQVVVVDNASTDGMPEEVRSRWPHIPVLTQPCRRGLPANLNQGIRATSAPLVMLCNPDLTFPDGAVDTLASFLESRPRAGMAAPKLLSPEGDRRPSARRWYTLDSLVALKLPWRPGSPPQAVARSVYDDWDYTEARQVDWVPCPATMVRRTALNEVGLMDERFRLYFDDVDISLRMHLGGWEVWCVPAAEIVHYEQRASVTVLSPAWRWHLFSLGKFAWKHRGLGPPGGPPRVRRG